MIVFFSSHSLIFYASDDAYYHPLSNCAFILFLYLHLSSAAFLLSRHSFALEFFLIVTLSPS